MQFAPATYKNPVNGYEETVDSSVFTKSWLGGPLFFAARGAWSWFFISAVLALLTFGFSLFVVPFYSAKILESHYLRKGWVKTLLPVKRSHPVLENINDTIAVLLMLLMGSLFTFVMFNAIVLRPAREFERQQDQLQRDIESINRIQRDTMYKLERDLQRY